MLFRSHDSHKSALRFDSANMGKAETVKYGTDGTMSFNVCWNAGQMKIKGEKHITANNVTFNAISRNGIGIAVLDNPNMGGFNKESVTVNNIGVLSGHFSRQKPLPGKQQANLNVKDNEVMRMLRDPINLDFRPRRNKKGVSLKGVHGKMSNLVIGAYNADCKNYWIPGRKQSRASSPVPPNKAVKVQQDCSLIWLQAYKSDKAELYLGLDKKSVEKAEKGSKEYKGEFKNNLFTPGKLKANTVYHWRVDSIINGKRTRGEVWSFKTR